MTHQEILSMHVAIADEGARSPVEQPVAEIFPKALLDGWQRSEAQRHAEWLTRLKSMTCAKASEEVKARGHALLIWVDTNGEMRAQRVDREHSVFREFVPAYLRRSA